MKYFLLCFLIVMTSKSVDAQLSMDIPFKDIVGKDMTLGLSGGLRNPQFSQIDFDNDGRKDLFIFDKTGGKPLCFLNKGGVKEVKYILAPQYEKIFPPLQVWALLHDFNKDGLEDLFTLPDLGISGIQIYRASRENGEIVFRKVRQPFFNTLSITIENAFTNLYSAITDIPSIIDVDDDGDTDILTFDPDGGKMVWFDNESVQKGFKSDSFFMVQKDLCFGRFYESMFSSTLFLSKDSLICSNGESAEGRGPRHSGSTVLAYDHDCDGDKDLLLGDIASNGLAFLRNNGSRYNAWMSQQTIVFPSNEPINLPLFIGAFRLDINNDGLLDLIVAPSDFDGGLNNNHIWLYLNESNNCVPSYSLESKSFLVNQMVSIGAKSVPTFIDINGDGLKDILITGNGLTVSEVQKNNQIFYYKNTGTKSNPSFKLEDDNLLQWL
jgi:hypothetical protein